MVILFCELDDPMQNKSWDCVQVRRAWRWATFIVHELGVVRTCNYDSFHWKQFIFGERIPTKYGKKIKVWHLLRGIMLWAIWSKRNDNVFNYERWHESKVKHMIWDELIIYAKAAWDGVIKQIKISSFSTVAMSQGFDKTWDTKNILCKRNNLQIEWSSKRHRKHV